MDLSNPFRQVMRSAFSGTTPSFFQSTSVVHYCQSTHSIRTNSPIVDISKNSVALELSNSDISRRLYWRPRKGPAVPLWTTDWN